jgi:hypothetical protein
MKLDTLIATLFILAALLVTCAGCEARKFTATRPDGTVITYERVTAIGDSQSEGVSVSKAGDDLTVDVGATGSEAKVEVLQAVLEAIK